ncbi:MAG: hypothetical protein ACREIW_16420 [Chthoniobacterales bacterium]
MMVLWIATRRWWSIAPEVFLPLLMGCYCADLVVRRDLPVVALLSAGAATFFFPIDPAVRTSSGLPMLAMTLTPAEAGGFAATLKMAIVSAALIYAAGSAAFVLGTGRARGWCSYVILAILLAGFFASGLAAQTTPGPDGLSVSNWVAHEPSWKGYAFDGDLYLRVFYRMKSGVDYYAALADAFLGHAHKIQAPTSVLGWRLPTLFLFWKIFFPSGAALAKGFLILGVLSGIMAFLAARALSTASLAIPVAALVCGYLFYGAVTAWLPMMEYWAVPMSLTALFLFATGRTASAALPALLAPLIREVYIFLLLGGLIAAFALRERRPILAWISAGLGFAVVWFIHYVHVKSMIGLASTSADWLQGGGWRLALGCITFSTAALFNSLFTAVAFAAMGIAGLALIRSRATRIFALVSTLPLLLVTPFFGNQWNSYWGISIMPLAFVGIACLASSCYRKFDVDRGR